jgi:hypothetical protein
LIDEDPSSHTHVRLEVFSLQKSLRCPSALNANPNPIPPKRYKFPSSPYQEIDPDLPPGAL